MASCREQLLVVCERSEDFGMWVSMAFDVKVTATSCSISVTLADFVCDASGSRDISGSLMCSSIGCPI